MLPGRFTWKIQVIMWLTIKNNVVSHLRNQSWRLHRFETTLDELRVGMFRWLSWVIPPDDDLVIVTGADRKYFPDLRQLLESVFTHEAESKVIVYDLGLKETQRRELVKTYPGISIRSFDFAKYPEYFDIKKNAGEYAWKPVIIADVFEEFKTQIIWMDSRNILVERLNDVRRIIRFIGVYSPKAFGNVKDWTHPETRRYLNVKPWLLNRHNLSAGAAAFRYQSARARKIVDAWRHCALTKGCIAPEGSNRSNHRQDLSVFTVLCHQNGVTRFMPRKRLNFLIHQDVS